MDPLNLRAIVENDERGQTFRAFVFVVIVLFSLGVPAVVVFLDRGYLNSTSAIIVLAIVSTVAGMLTAAVVMLSKGRSSDIADRYLSSRIEDTERRIKSELDQQVQKRIQELASDSFGNADTVIGRLVQERIDNGLISSVGDALARQTDEVAREIRRWKHVQETFERIRIRLDGPASRSERAAYLFQFLAAALAISGILIAFFRVYFSGGFVLQLLSLAPAMQQSIWSIVFVQSAPWVSLIILIEFTALLFFRFYLRAIELQRYFTRELANIDAKLAALRIVLDLGSAEQAIDAAKAMMVAENNAIAPESSPDSVGALSNLIGSIGTLVKDVKSGPKDG